VIHAFFLITALWTAAQTPADPVALPAPADADADGDGFVDTTQQPGPGAPATVSPTTTTPEAPPEAPSEAPPDAAPAGDIVAPVVPSPAPTPGFPPPTPEQRGVLVRPQASPSLAPPASSSLSSPADYLAWYAVDYAALAVAGGLFAASSLAELTPAPALLGPRFDLDKPDLAVLFDPRLDGVIGRPLVREKVPTAAVVAGGVTVLAGTALVDLMAGGDAPRTHALVVGGAEALLGTAVLTEALKLSFGRLRPDFRERWLRAACGGNVAAADGLDCRGVDDGFVVSRADVLDGMRSFPSGHTSASFAVLTFSTLAIGSRWIWSDDALARAPAWAPPLATLAVGTLAAGAGFTAASRLSDGRHHAEDVVVGAALGTALGASSWLLYFDARGRVRTRWPVRVVPTTTMSVSGAAPALAVTGSLP